MANGFLNIPDWFSWENQGAGIAVAQLASDRPRDLIVMMVDNPPGQNQGLYRVGKHLDSDGNVIGGWTPWMNVPDWFPWENRGAGIAVTDLDGNGQLDLIIFMIDHAADQNHAYYRVGRHLDGDGNVTAGWSDWIKIPNWPAGENQYGNIAIADVSRSGRPDLLVLRVNHPSQPNQNNSAFYQIAWDLDAHGIASRWSSWIQVPDWFSQDNQGAGIAVADMRNLGQLDLVIFQIDNPPELNQAFYRIGEDLDAQGVVQGAWTPWMGVPGWFSWENQGGGVAPILHDGHRDLVVAMVDNPPQVNSGQYRMLELVDDPQRVGKWEVLPFDSEVLAIHAALLPTTGSVLFFAGSGNNPNRFKSPDFGDTTKKIWASVVWDSTVTPAPGTDDNFFHPNTLRDNNGRPLDFFCGGESFLPDGRLLAAGGTHQYANGQPFLGLKEAGLFDPQTKQWIHAPSMAHGRWYPTLVTLHDGRILVASGLDENGEINPTLEIYDPTTNTWQAPLQAPPEFAGLPLYAHLFELQDGRLFFTGGKMNDDDRGNLGPCLIDISTNPIGITPVGGLSLSDLILRNQSASVLLPPAQDQKVMIMGGGPTSRDRPATARADIIDLSNPHQPNLAYHPAQAMNLARMHLNAVLLPDHTVFVSGGAPKQEMKISASLQSEIYDPATDTWQLAAIAQIPRLYHSVALLLPDGKVIAAGGNPEQGKQVQWGPPADPNEELRMELYSPPYLFRSPRPVIDQAPQQIHYGQSFDINSSQAGNIQWVSLIKNGVTTHSFNTGQRLVDLAITAQGNDVITVTAEPNPTIAPPGWYMLFIVNQSKIPSVAKWVHLS